MSRKIFFVANSNFCFFICRPSKVLIQKERRSYIIVCFALVLPLSGNQSFISIAFFDIFMKRSKPIFQVIHHLDALKVSANTLVLQKPQLFAIMALLTKLSLSTSKKQLRKTQVWKWQKRRLRHQLHPCPIYQREDVVLEIFRVRTTRHLLSA